MTEIAWRPWSEEAFAEAKQQDQPVLLSITAVWCQYCRAMDEQTYTNEAIVQFINDNFIAVRVDSDKRPDVNARYTQGGWPTTCLLTPDGDLLWGGTFVQPNDMAQLLPQVLHAYRNDKQGLSQHVANLREQLKQRNTPPPLDPNAAISPDIPRGVLLASKFEFDFAFGGFGHNGQKFPHIDTVELVMEQYSRSLQANAADDDLKLMLERTLVGLSTGEMWDRGDGGFFRYTQTPDWRNPQVEKLLDDNAQIARLFCRAYQLLGDDRWKEAAAKTFAYLKTQLYDAERGVWGGSQAADPEYYSQPLEERKEWNPPAVDATVLAGPNAQAVRAQVAWWQATGEVDIDDNGVVTDALATARRAMDFLLGNLVDDNGVVTHCLLAEDAPPGGRVPAGLLSDSADMVAACLDLYEAGQGVTYLDRAEAIANWVRGHLEDPVGGSLLDTTVRPDAIGSLRIGARDVQDNMQMADALLRLFLATGEEEHAKLAQRVLQAFQPAAGQMGLFAAPIALAIERAVLPPVLVYVLGKADDPKAQALLQAAHRAYRFERFVQPLDPSNSDDAEHIENLGFDPSAAPIAHIQVATTPLAPTVDPETLTETVRSAVWENPAALLEQIGDEA